MSFRPSNSRRFARRAGVLAAVCAVGWGAIPLAWAVEPPAAVLQAEQQRIAAIQRGVKSSICVFSLDGNGGGSGVVISPDGFALTNFHVVQPVGNYLRCSMADGRLYDSVVVGVDPVGDVALIKLLGREDFPAATLADSELLKQGDWCFAVGNPFLLATDFQPTVTYGIVSGVHRYQYPSGTLIEYADCIQTDTSINPGNSGGPLFNTRGEVVGINGRISFEKRVRVNVGVGYAISINQIKNFLGCLHSGRILDHATAGFNVLTSGDGRVTVSSILESSDAYRRGIRYGDQIVSFAGREIETANALKNALGVFPKGWRVAVKYRRDGQTYDTLVRLTGVHAEEELLQLVDKAPKEAAPPHEGDPHPPGRGPPDPPQPKLPLPKLPLPKLPLPKLPNLLAKKAAEIPPAVAALIKMRKGYANYYFGELNRDRVWRAFTAQGDFSTLTGEWSLEGEVAGVKVDVKLNDAASSGRFAAGEAQIDSGKDLDAQLGPAGSGGLLAALHLWRQMLVQGPKNFGDTSYYGTAPCTGAPELCDLLVGVKNVVETQFIFQPAGGRLLQMELFGEPDGDPCELSFLDYQPLDGRQFPRRMLVYYGDNLYTDIRWTKIELGTASTKGAAP